jgi:hypothetical protein
LHFKWKFISRDQIVAAMNTWVFDEEKLAQIVDRSSRVGRWDRKLRRLTITTDLPCLLFTRFWTIERTWSLCSTVEKVVGAAGDFPDTGREEVEHIGVQ